MPRVQVEVSKVASEAGIRFPVFLTRAVYDAYVTVPPNVTGQDEAARIWDNYRSLRRDDFPRAAGIFRVQPSSRIQLRAIHEPDGQVQVRMLEQQVGFPILIAIRHAHHTPVSARIGGAEE